MCLCGFFYNGKKANFLGMKFDELIFSLYYFTKLDRRGLPAVGRRVFTPYFFFLL